tara:strand:+ start:4692 stop:5030 length:339 start_codon:yes stop_codon:yes gene_type:complete
MAFKLNNIYEVFGHNAEFSNGDRIVNEIKLPRKVLGQINPNGVIEINKSATPSQKRKAVTHETHHLEQIKKGILRFDHNNYYYRKDGKSPINVIPSSQINTYDRDLPWEQHD